ncbi:MAG TPA: bifunctional riboflavin kinase/FAD synthetase [Jiangellaceae bacterium]|nr:bifunctional riboflavin kinase/FAD synthetase [Jiangellaceae bacterium]
MQWWTDLAQVPAGFGPSVVTLGNFDGVHRGHQRVLGAMVSDARQLDAAAVVVTFDPHPAVLHRPHEVPPQITGLADRLALLADTGLDATLVQAYTWEFAQQSPDEFVRRTLVEGLRATRVVVGHDVRFGWGNSGDLATMVELGREHGFEVDVIDEATAGEAGTVQRRWSSTWVRELLASGEVYGAQEILGRCHRLRGPVVRGEARGADLGFPTANLSQDSEGMVPADGVYAGWLSRVGTDGAPHAQDQRPDTWGNTWERLPAAISVGTNPTFEGDGRTVEAYVLDRSDLDLYGDVVMLEFVSRLRPTVRFDSVEALVAQMNADVDAARVLLR